MNSKQQMSREELLEVIDILTKNNIKITEENIKLKAELRKWKPKKIKQYTLDGEYIKTFENTTKASKAMFGNASCIRACLRGDVKSSYGYIWKYEDE